LAAEVDGRVPVVPVRAVGLAEVDPPLPGPVPDDHQEGDPDQDHSGPAGGQEMEGAGGHGIGPSRPVSRGDGQAFWCSGRTSTPAGGSYPSGSKCPVRAHRSATTVANSIASSTACWYGPKSLTLGGTTIGWADTHRTRENG